MTRALVSLTAGVLASAFTGCGKEGGAPAPGAGGGPSSTPRKVIRMGHFPNLTHAQGVIAHALSEKGKGWFEERLGVEVQWFVYNAGPSAMEAFFAGSLDLTYVGPSPALNAHLRSQEKEVRIIAGAAEGGEALVVQGDGRIQRPEEFRKKRVATPQLGNTQDVMCRVWLLDHGFKVTQIGGDVLVVPTHNPDMLTLFKKGSLDAAWTVEPWVSRLELEAGGKVFLEEKEAVTTILVSSARFLKAEPELVAGIARAHRELTEWIVAHQEEAQLLLREWLKRPPYKIDMPSALFEKAWARLRFTSSIDHSALQRFVKAAQRVGFLERALDYDKLMEPIR